MKQQSDEAGRQFEAAARELVEATKRARAAGTSLTEEMQSAVQRLDDVQEKLQRTESIQDRQFEPVALSGIVLRRIEGTFDPQDRQEAMNLLVNECGRKSCHGISVSTSPKRKTKGDSRCVPQVHNDGPTSFANQCRADSVCSERVDHGIAVAAVY